MADLLQGGGGKREESAISCLEELPRLEVGVHCKVSAICVLHQGGRGLDVAEQVRLVVEVVEQRVLGLGIAEDSRKENKKNGEKDHHPDRGQVEHSLTGDQAPQLLYQEQGAGSLSAAAVVLAFKPVSGSCPCEFRHIALQSFVPMRVEKR